MEINIVWDTNTIKFCDRQYDGVGLGRLITVRPLFWLPGLALVFYIVKGTYRG